MMSPPTALFRGFVWRDEWQAKCITIAGIRSEAIPIRIPALYNTVVVQLGNSNVFSIETRDPTVIMVICPATAGTLALSFPDLEW